jgi:uronate dehydrogenase
LRATPRRRRTRPGVNEETFAMKQTVLTGAGGAIGSVLRRHFAATGRQVRVSDIKPLGEVAPNETVVQGDITDPAFVRTLLEGAGAVVHLAGIPTNRPLSELIALNFVALNALYEAARDLGVGRIVYASSNHATGMYAAGQRISARDAVNPDSHYGLSKVWGEGLARMFWEKHGLESVCLRIGSFLAQPKAPRNLSTWLSHGDTCALVDASLDTPGVGFDIVYGVSANTRAWWDNSMSKVPYRPVDNAEEQAAHLEAMPQDPLEARFQGGDYAADEYTRQS